MGKCKVRRNEKWIKTWGWRVSNKLDTDNNGMEVN